MPNPFAHLSPRARLICGLVLGPLAVWWLLGSTNDTATTTDPSTAVTQPSDPKMRWCDDASWVNSAATLYLTTYGGVPRPITEAYIDAGMSQGGSLGVNYGFDARMGLMPVGIDPSELTAFLISMARAEQQGTPPRDYATSIAGACEGSTGSQP